MSRPRRTACLATLLMMAVASCGGNEIGETCASNSDCASGLQCFDHTCVPLCDRHTDCGDGHICRPGGVCELVVSMIGDECTRELDCGPGQACHLADDDLDNDGVLHASCDVEVPGEVLDATCTADEDCRTGTCVIGRCVDLCDIDNVDDDCPASHACAKIPRELGADDVASFHGCLPATGTIVYRVPFAEAYRRFFLPVPDTAESVALVAAIDDPTQLVGAARVESPSEALLYKLPLDREEYFSYALRHEPTPGMSTLLMPQTPDDPRQWDLDEDRMIDGAYVVELGSYVGESFKAGTAIPTVDVIYKLDDAETLDVHFYFLNLDDHPCEANLGGVLDAATAQTSTDFQDYLEKIDQIFANAGVVFDRENATYTDLRDRPDLDGLSEARLGDLLSLADQDGGISVFFVRTLSPAGLQGLVGGPPGPPGRAGTRASGIAIGVDTLCYRSWTELARITAHEIARSLGLHRSVEPDGFGDPIDDSPDSSDNLMYYSEFGGEVLSDDQRRILGLSAAMR